MSWTTPADLRAQVMRLWDNGQILTSVAGGEPVFPRRLTIKRPTSSELSDRFGEARAWASALLQGSGYRVVVREVRHSIIGQNSIPDEVWVDNTGDALRLIGKEREAKRFARVVELTKKLQPGLVSWLIKRPLKALELAKDWQTLLDITGWMQAHPRPGIYIRQIELPGMHTKFIEAHRAVLKELLDMALPPDAVYTDSAATGISGFCRRYGFIDKPGRVRFRILDRELSLLPGCAEQDIQVNQAVFDRLNLKVNKVFITENETDFLAFPDIPDSIVIFGGGYGFDMLTSADWLHRKAIYYWGDIDTHGFGILDQLRAYFPNAVSILMDRATLFAHRPQWVTEPKPLSRDLARLTDDERELFDDLRYNRLGPAVRLEQERIGFGWVVDALKAV